MATPCGVRCARRLNGLRGQERLALASIRLRALSIARFIGQGGRNQKPEAYDEFLGAAGAQSSGGIAVI